VASDAVLKSLGVGLARIRDTRAALDREHAPRFSTFETMLQILQSLIGRSMERNSKSESSNSPCSAHTYGAEAYRQAYKACRMEGDLLPRANAVQELVTAWKLLWSWRKRH